MPTPTRRFVLVALAVTTQLALACGSDGNEGQGPGTGNPSTAVQTCVNDADCPSGKGCYDTDDPADRYCATLCAKNADCGKQLLCPSLATLDEADCRGAKSVSGKGVCQLFDGSKGPKGCAGQKADPKGPDTNVKACSKDADCGPDKGCYQTDDPSDGYCTPLCADNPTCAFQVLCPALTVLEESDCRQKSSEGKGVCQIFDGSQGPKGCAAAQPK